MPDADSAAPSLSRVLQQIARDRFGFESLRPDQEAVIRLLMQGSDVLAVMPTGSGKSAIYQTAGVLIPGGTLVVSPLIALQRDQLAHIDGHDLPAAGVLNSYTPAKRRRELFDKLAADDLEYLFLAPEQLASAETLEKLKKNPPSLVVIDEAHCVSEWGHDFRPDYGQLGKVIDALKTGKQRPRVLALTATATPVARDDVIRQLRMHKPKVHAGDLDRPELHLRVETMPDEATKRRLLPDRVTDLSGGKPNHTSGIVYVMTRKNAEDVAALLREHNIDACHYHGGMQRDERADAQENFTSGKCPVMVATNAFGMGIDKSDVRYVIHYDVPDSLDSYYQEVGRAGRDGGDAGGLLLYRDADLGRQRGMTAPLRLNRDEVADVLETVMGDGTSIDEATLKDETEQTGGRLRRTLDLLERVGAILITLDGEATATASFDNKQVNDYADDVVAEQDRFRDYRTARLDAMEQFATTGRCRRAFILDYFGQPDAEPCGVCDNCVTGKSTETREKRKQADDGLPFRLGSTVDHRSLGRGQVQRYEGDKVVVLFESAGLKSIVVDFAIKNELMKRA